MAKKESGSLRQKVDLLVADKSVQSRQMEERVDRILKAALEELIE